MPSPAHPTRLPAHDRYHRLWWLLAGCLVAAASTISVAATRPEFSLLRRVESALDLGAGALLLIVFSALGAAMMVWRVVLAARYRPIASVADADLPGITVIVPAYNEGAQVLHTLRSLAASDYPREKLTIVAVDDGSADDTWRYIHQGGDEFPRLVQTVRCVRNRGKRHALTEGIRRSRGDVIVTVDSDSEVAPDTLRNLVSPFVVDRRVGAVAGNVRVLNEGSAIARMLDIVFTFGFDFIRAGQSEVDTVFCTPGALSAYRRDLVLAVLDEWSNQTFLGRPANIGEDRAMTNLILRAGYHVKFQGNAVVWTEVPTKLAPLSRMLLRWARSNVRETVVMARFIFTPFRPGSAVGARLHFAHGAAKLVIQGAAWAPFVAFVALNPEVGAATLLLGVPLAALPAALVFALLRSPAQAWWSAAYSLYSLIALSWITPYAIISLHKTGWLTRQLKLVPQPVSAPRRRTATAA